MTSRALTLGLAFLASAVVVAQSPYVPARVFVSAKKHVADLETVLADVARADVVFVGEQHDDANTHRLERWFLEGLARRRGGVVLSLEMFERDVQEPLDHFAMGHLDESEFLKEARPWPRYASDYKPLVDFALSKNWPIVAANVPRAVAAEVSKSGLGVLKGKSAEDAAWFAHDLECPVTSKEFARFRASMTNHSTPSPPLDAPTLERYYLAQCLKDETMAEAIAGAYAGGSIGGKSPLVVSLNGAYHTDYGDGLVARTRRRLAGKRLVTVTILPVPDIDAIAPTADDRRRADYLIYTVGK